MPEVPGLQYFVLASANRKKIEEIREILPKGYSMLSLAEAGVFSELPETGNTFEENALQKAREVYRLSGKPALADDSGLVVDALGGEPGVQSAYFAGHPRDDKANLLKLIALMGDVDQRSARFVTVLALVRKGGEYLFRGEVEGEIARQAAGEYGFGYDPVFVPQGHIKTFAEMQPEEKNACSHRKRALDQLRLFFESLPNEAASE